MVFGGLPASGFCSPPVKKPGDFGCLMSRFAVADPDTPALLRGLGSLLLPHTQVRDRELNR
ncbi:hypothetical protein HDA39_007984 [Kribbella italica]|uniref:Uncharacterized protein n=1 Tax=Kribbella italica TaxID=1540520 RepID=A0A7W9JFZ3_9ACTN|nr:hypothetical protein [Kribbella italica]